MCRVIVFISGSGGVGKTSLIYAVSKKISSMGKMVCSIDLNFRLNHLSLLYDAESENDFKEYIIGRCDTDSVLNKENLYLNYVKTNSNFDYEKHIELIKFFIDEIKNRFDYVFIDINNGYEKTLQSILNVSNEVFVVCSDGEIDVLSSAKQIQKVKKLKNICNVKVIINKAKIIHSIKNKRLNENDLKEILNCEILYVVPKFYKNHYFKEKYFNKNLKKHILNLSYSIITNKRYGEKPENEYRGIVGLLKKWRYYKYE